MSYFDIYGSALPGTLNANYVGSVVLGLQFQSAVACNVSGVKFYKGTSDTGTHVGTLWTDAGSSLASANFTGETASGWQTLTFGSPVAILANTNYRVSYLCPTGFGDNTTGYFTSAQLATMSSPLSVAASGGCYKYSASNTFPNTGFVATGYFVQPFVDAAWGPFSMIRSRVGTACVVGAMKGICIEGVSSINGDTFSRHLQTGVREELVDGNPSPPCLALDYPGMWRFRWAVASGSRTISITAKQVSNVTGKRPSLKIKANPSIGVNADAVSSAPSGTGWVTIPAASVTPSAEGVLWVELWNNDTDTFQSTAYFDHIVTS